MRATIFALILINSCCMFSQTPANDPHWELVWEDEFNFFDDNKWIKANYALHLPEPQIYLASNVYSLDGNLVIKVNNQPTTCPPNPIQTTWACSLAQPGVSYQYNSGWVETNNNFNTQYGYIEAKIKLPYRYGFWPAFWTWRGNGIQTSNEAEIDIFEMLGHLPPNIVGTNVHKHYCSTHTISCSAIGQALCPSENPNILCNGQDLNLNNFSYSHWHIYGLEWTPSKIIWYIDGIQMRVFSNPGIVDPVRTILNLAIEPGYHTPLFPAFTDYMFIDYVKVYDTKKDCNTNLNVCNYNFGLHDNRVKKRISIGNSGCINSLSAGQNIVLRASEEVLINGDFLVPVGAQLYIDVNTCQ